MSAVFHGMMDTIPLAYRQACWKRAACADGGGAESA
jgi:hypothetical protein